MTHQSADNLLVLHAVRIQGMTNAAGVVTRFAVNPHTVQELLLDDEARGWVQRVAFADLSGWTLTKGGRDEGERLLADELRDTGARPAVETAYRSFSELNGRLLTLMTKWQVRPQPRDALAPNDHSDWAWDEDILKGLGYLALRLRPIGDQLTDALPRFAGYPERFASALNRVDRGERRWIDETGIDSCHTVWFQLHEDLLASLGLERGEDLPEV